MKLRLTDAAVAALRCPEGRKDMLVFDTALRGFAVRVQASGGKIWLFRYRLGSASRRVPLGRFGEVTAAKARRDAERLRGEVLAGRDPWGERKAAAAATLAAERAARARAEEAAFTVAALLELYAEHHLARLRPATRRDALSRLRRHLAPIRDKPATAIGRREAAQVVDAAARAGETTARRVRDYARAMWAWARRRGSLPETAPNPWEGAPVPGRDLPRDRVLTGEEIGLVWRASARLPIPHGPMLRFLMLTLARREEVTAMTWGEVAPDLSTWTLPAGRSKNRKPHVVHLAAPARAILRTLLGAEEDAPLPPRPRPVRLVFGLPNGRPITSHSWVKRTLDALMAELRAQAAAEAGAEPPEPIPGWVVHDFRRTGVTVLAERGVPPHVADRLLNHVQGTIRGVAAIYQRGEFLAERRHALDLWAAHILACAGDRPAASNVTPLAAHRLAPPPLAG